MQKEVPRKNGKNNSKECCCKNCVQWDKKARAWNESQGGKPEICKTVWDKVDEYWKKQTQYDAMTVQKVQLRKTYQMAEKEAADVQLKNIRQYLRIKKTGERKTW